MGELIISILILIFLVLLAKVEDKEKVKIKIDYIMLTRVVAYFREHNLSLGFLITWTLTHEVSIITLDPDVMIEVVYKILDHEYFALVAVDKARPFFVYREEGAGLFCRRGRFDCGNRARPPLYRRVSSYHVGRTCLTQYERQYAS